MTMENLEKKAKGALSEAFNILSGKNGRLTALFGWSAVLCAGAALFVPPVISLSSAFQLTEAALCASMAHIRTKQRQAAKGLTV